MDVARLLLFVAVMLGMACACIWGFKSYLEYQERRRVEDNSGCEAQSKLDGMAAERRRQAKFDEVEKAREEWNRSMESDHGQPSSPVAESRRAVAPSVPTVSPRVANPKPPKPVVRMSKSDCQAMYSEILLKFRSGKFSIVSNPASELSPGEYDGSLAYLLPFGNGDEFLVCESTANGIRSIYAIGADGACRDCTVDDLPGAGRDYLMTTGGKVYFHSKRKKAYVGKLSKTEDQNPAELFFGDIFEAVQQLGIAPANLKFEIAFVPADCNDPIICETVDYGHKNSSEIAMRAVEGSYPMHQVSYAEIKRIKKPKRTIVLSDGDRIENRMDKRMYVPRVCPPSYRNTNSFKMWKELYDKAREEERLDKKYEDEVAKMKQEILTEAKKRHSKRIGKLYELGNLYFRARLNERVPADDETSQRSGMIDDNASTELSSKAEPFAAVEQPSPIAKPQIVEPKSEEPRASETGGKSQEEIDRLFEIEMKHDEEMFKRKFSNQADSSETAR